MLTILTAAAVATMQPAPVHPAENKKVEVMVLGMYHLANPGQDMINVDAGDVMQDGPQEELMALVNSLADWKPTKVLVETQSPNADLTLSNYARADELIATEASETYQIGYRLARTLGHANVYGFDEQPGDGEPDYFPMGKVQQWSAAHGKQAEIGALFGWAQNYIMSQAKEVASCSIAEKLVFHNGSANAAFGHSRLYYGMLGFGDADNQPGAELNAYWYMRNAKMFAKADMVAEPGDRVLIIVGSGHKYWLDHFASVTPGYSLVDATPYLEATEGKRC
ncbi:DUF5694 domain-containing protein [Sphingomicrobium flavum]|uniref:DUF5694 domain-containing protein n=1 Tax=Sphingomicrobium flavum TaxID=1229164 RepID=UPI0021ADB603|nr:DUF5694 domain-containing protein [Sphingomicrobium flavum]